MRAKEFRGIWPVYEFFFSWHLYNIAIEINKYVRSRYAMPPSHPGRNNIISHGCYRARYIRSFVAHYNVYQYPGIHIPPRIINVFVMRIYYHPLLCFEIFRTSALRRGATYVRAHVSILTDYTSPGTSRLGQRLNIARRNPWMSAVRHFPFEPSKLWYNLFSRRKYLRVGIGTCKYIDTDAGRPTHGFSRLTRLSEVFSTSATRCVLYFTLIWRQWDSGGEIKPRCGSHRISWRKLGERRDINDLLSLKRNIMTSGDFYPFFHFACRHD